MVNDKVRIDKDSMGELEVPKDALYGAQTQRAVNNFPISGLTMPRSIIKAMGLIKWAAAKTNGELNLLKSKFSTAIQQSAELVSHGLYDTHFPIDIFQTGSGTSTNMNTNEVIANLAQKHTKLKIHPNDHVNMGQSSNDVFPTAIHLSCALEIHTNLLPSLQHLTDTIVKRAKSLENVTKTGRTHLMDAMPLTLGQELSGWATQIQNNLQRISSSSAHVKTLAIGGTAVGTGINAHRKFAEYVCIALSDKTGIKFIQKPNYFEALSSQDAVVELSGQLRCTAVSLMKIANDLRWMNSGPLAGLSEIELPAVQPGSSIMPGKVNPVIPEAICMLSAQVIGNDTTITIGGQSGNFQLNVMLPVIAYNILQSIQIISNGARILADKVIAKFKVNEVAIQKQLAMNPILVTALNSVIGYEKGAEIAKCAYKEGRPIREVAESMTKLSSDDLDRLLDPFGLTQGGIKC